MPYQSNAPTRRRPPERELVKALVVALPLAFGVAGTATVATTLLAQPAHAFGLSDITGAVKKVGSKVKAAAKTVGKDIKNTSKIVGGKVKSAAKTVGKDIKNTSKIVGRNAKDWATSVGAAGKDIGRAGKWVGVRIYGGAKLMGDDLKIAGKWAPNLIPCPLNGSKCHFNKKGAPVKGTYKPAPGRWGATTRTASGAASKSTGRRRGYCIPMPGRRCARRRPERRLPPPRTRKGDFSATASTVSRADRLRGRRPARNVAAARRRATSRAMPPARRRVGTVGAKVRTKERAKSRITRHRRNSRAMPRVRRTKRAVQPARKRSHVQSSGVARDRSVYGRRLKRKRSFDRGRDRGRNFSKRVSRRNGLRIQRHRSDRSFRRNRR